MIVIETNRIYAVYVRTNHHVQWRYAKYCGRWETVEKAIEVARERTAAPFQYIVEEMGAGIVAKGDVK